MKGCFMDLMHAQFNHGRLSIEEIKICLGQDFENSWPVLQKKFKQDEKGLFFNERLETEKQKRAAFTESRRQSRLGKYKSHDTTSEKHTLSRMENENVNENVSKEKGGMGENKIVFVKQETFYLVPVMQAEFKKQFTGYFPDQQNDFPALKELAEKIKALLGLSGLINEHQDQILKFWIGLIKHQATDPFLSKYSISQVNKHFQAIIQSQNAEKKNFSTGNGKIRRFPERVVIDGLATGAGTF